MNTIFLDLCNHAAQQSEEHDNRLSAMRPTCEMQRNKVGNSCRITWHGHTLDGSNDDESRDNTQQRVIQGWPPFFLSQSKRRCMRNCRKYMPPCCRQSVHRISIRSWTGGRSAFPCLHIVHSVKYYFALAGRLRKVLHLRTTACVDPNSTRVASNRLFLRRWYPPQLSTSMVTQLRHVDEYYISRPMRPCCATK